MKTNKFTLLIAILLLPMMMYSQVGKNKIVLSTGETTLQVNPTMKDTDIKSLRKPQVDTMFYKMKSDYRSLEEAAYGTNKILREIEQGHQPERKSNNALAFITSAGKLKAQRETVRMRAIWDSLAMQGPDIETLEALYAIYGNKPTSYINGVEVGDKVVSKLQGAEILRKTIKTTNAVSDNPNGEVWYEVADKTFRKLKITPVAKPDDDKEADDTAQ